MEKKRDEHLIKEGEFKGMKGFIVTEAKEFFYNATEIENMPFKLNNTRVVEEVIKKGEVVGYLVKEKADIFLTGDAFLKSIDQLHQNKFMLEKDIKGVQEVKDKVEENIAKYLAWREKALEFSKIDYMARQAKKSNAPKSQEKPKTDKEVKN
jgi:hypothetical protein